MDILRTLISLEFDKDHAIRTVYRALTSSRAPAEVTLDDCLALIAAEQEESTVCNEGQPLDDVSSTTSSKSYCSSDAALSMKCVVIARKDLRMSAGKVAAQVGHAIHSMCQNRTRVNFKDLFFYDWEDNGGSTIVVVSVKSLQEFDEVLSQASALGIDAFPICDAGRTEVEPGSVTCAALGPAPSGIISLVTAHLGLYK